MMGCSMIPTTTPSITTTQSSFKNLNTKLIPQKGDNSCWVASLIMAYNYDTTMNKEGIPPRTFKNIKAEISSKVVEDSVLHYNQLSWDKIKKSFDMGSPILFYKYFNDKEAHVFVGTGYQETKTEKWILINDPWPKNKGNQNATAFDNLTKPIFTNVTTRFPKIAIGKEFENSFSILANSSVLDQISNTFQESDSVKTTNSAEISNPVKGKPNNIKEVNNLAQNWINNINQYDSNFLSIFNVKKPGLDTVKLKVDLDSYTEVNNVFIYTYDGPSNLRSKDARQISVGNNSDKGSLYDHKNIYYITISDDKIKKVVLSIEKDIRNNNKAYISRIEPYLNSKQATLDNLSNGLKLKIPKVNMHDTKRGYLVYFTINNKELVYDQFDQIENVSKLEPIYKDALGKIKVFNASEAILKPQFKNNTQKD